MCNTEQETPEEPIFEVISKAGERRFFRSIDEAALRTLLGNYPGMMGPGVAMESSVEALPGSREEQFDYVVSFVNEHHRKRWCNAGLCGCMGCANRAGGLGSLGFTVDDWEDWQSRRIQYIGLANLS